MERVKGIEPSSQPWEGHILPLNHTRGTLVNMCNRLGGERQGWIRGKFKRALYCGQALGKRFVQTSTPTQYQQGLACKEFGLVNGNIRTQAVNERSEISGGAIPQVHS